MLLYNCNKDIECNQVKGVEKMKNIHFVLFVVGLLFLFGTLFTRYYLLGNWSNVLILMMVDSLLLTAISFLKIKEK